jgi:hypothetical protein
MKRMGESATPWMTIFTAPKSFEDEHIRLIQRNAILSWLNLGNEVEIILIGDDAGVAEIASEFGLKHLPNVEKNEKGTPLVSSIFELARVNSESPILAYLNADIIALPDMLSVTRKVMKKLGKFLIVGQRWDIDIRDAITPDDSLTGLLQQRINEHGVLHPQGGSDYFIYPRTCFTEMPKFAIGRAGWDNWMIYQARNEKLALVDGTGAINIIHQQHDYRHLPGGQPHYRTPETYENVRLAGGKRTIFDLKDTNWQVKNDTLRQKPVSWKRFWREVEIFPLITLKSMGLAQIAYGIFHPVKAYREFRAWLRQKNAVKVE